MGKLTSMLISLAIGLAVSACRPGTAPVTFDTQHTPSDHFPASGL